MEEYDYEMFRKPFLSKHIRYNNSIWNEYTPITVLGRVVYVLVYVLQPLWFALSVFTGMIIIMAIIWFVRWIITGKENTFTYFLNGGNGVGGD